MDCQHQHVLVDLCPVGPQPQYCFIDIGLAEPQQLYFRMDSGPVSPQQLYVLVDVGLEGLVDVGLDGPQQLFVRWSGPGWENGVGREFPMVKLKSQQFLPRMSTVCS